MVCIPPDKDITLRDSASSSTSGLSQEPTNCSPSYIEVSDPLNDTYVVDRPILRDLHAQNQDYTNRSYFLLLKSLLETQYQLDELQLVFSMLLYLSHKGNVNLHRQFDGSQTDPPLVSDMNTFLHDCTAS